MPDTVTADQLPPWVIKPLADFASGFPRNAAGEYVVLIDADFATWLLQRSGQWPCSADPRLVNPIAQKLVARRQHELDDVVVVVSKAGSILSGLEAVAAVVAANPPGKKGQEPRAPVQMAALLQIDTTPPPESAAPPAPEEEDA